MKEIIQILFFLLLFCHNNIAQKSERLSVKNPIKITGSIGSRNYFSAGSKSPMYQTNPLGYSLFGNVTIQLTKHLSLPFSISYSNRKTTFSQPFNQFGMSPTFKGITLHAGYRSLRFSEYTLNGFNILGAGFEVQKGVLRSGLIMGRFTRATANAEGYPTSFLRFGWAARLGIGKKNNYFDIIALSGKDEVSSIPSYEAYGLNPAKNIVIGAVLNQKIILSKKKSASILFKADGAISIYTGNLAAPMLDSANYNIPPIIFKTVSPTISSKGVAAYNASLTYNQRGVGIKIGYNRVDAGFASMGIYTTNNDIEVISFAPRFSLLKNKVSFNGNLRMQRDNLSGDKQKSTRRILPNAALNITPSRSFSISANINYSTMNQTAGIKQTNPVPIAQLMNQANYTVGLSPRITFGAKELGQSLNLAIGTNKVLDNGTDEDRKRYSEYSGLNASTNYSINVTQINASVQVGGNYFSLTNFDFATNAPITKNNYGFNATISKPFLKKTLNLNLSTAFTFSQNNDKANSLSLGASYRPAKRHSFSFGLNQAQSHYLNNENRNFKEFKGTLDYTYNFSR